MKIAVWKTGHAIADTVADAIHSGLQEHYPWKCHTNGSYAVGIAEPDLHIAYGILRGTADVFRECDRIGKPWVHLDRGFFRPSHYDGYYRISLRGTQQTTGLDRLPPDYDRLRALGVDMKPWRGFDESKPVLVCPPTQAVSHFFNTEWGQPLPSCFKIREKGDPNPINFADYNYVLTFNSSVGWQALAAGIPCISDTTHSIVGAWFEDVSIADLPDMQHKDRERLFGCQASLQLTLDEIRAGKIWTTINRLMSL